jgi:hypothetical protein
MVKAKGNVNFPMAQLDEFALEEESAIRSDKFRKGAVGFQGTKSKPQIRNEQVRSANIVCYRFNTKGHMSPNVKTSFGRRGSAWDGTPSHVGKQAGVPPWQPEVGVTQDGYKERSANRWDPRDPQDELIGVDVFDVSGARIVSDASKNLYSLQQQHTHGHSSHQGEDDLQVDYKGDVVSQPFIICFVNL